jgi:sulfoxide reductase heme-binding subunit YedZ
VTSALLVGMTVAVLASDGIEEAGVRVRIRATARSSVVLFALAFSASALVLVLVHFWPGRWTKWLRRKRRQVGLPFAVSHTIHYAAADAVAVLDPDQFFVEEGRRIPGVSTLGATALPRLMIATSFDTTTRMLGAKRWRALQLFGAWSL